MDFFFECRSWPQYYKQFTDKHKTQKRHIYLSVYLRPLKNFFVTLHRFWSIRQKRNHTSITDTISAKRWKKLKMPRQIASTYRGDDGEAVNFICIITIKIEKISHLKWQKAQAVCFWRKNKNVFYYDKILESYVSDKKYKAYYDAFRTFTEYLCSCTPNIDSNNTNIR